MWGREPQKQKRRTNDTQPKRQMKNEMEEVKRQISRKEASAAKFPQGKFVYNEIQKDILKLKNRLTDLKACFDMDFFTLCNRNY